MGQIHSYVLQVRVAEGDPFEAFEDNMSARDWVPTQVSEVWSRMSMNLGLWKDDSLQKCEMIHSASGKRSWIFTDTELFFCPIIKKADVFQGAASNWRKLLMA